MQEHSELIEIYILDLEIRDIIISIKYCVEVENIFH